MRYARNHLILAQKNVICDKSDESGMGRLPMDANHILLNGECGSPPGGKDG